MSYKHQYLKMNGQKIILLVNAFLMLLALMASNKKTGYYLERIIIKLPIYGQLYVYFTSTYLAQILTLLIKCKLIHLLLTKKKNYFYQVVSEHSY